MTTVTLQIPESVTLTAFDISMIVAAELYERGVLSSGQAAEMVGLSKRAFVELLGKYGVSVFGYTMEELENDLQNV